MRIIGAGIAGLLAGCTFQKATIFEANPENKSSHKALLRFRTPAVGDAVGIDFRKVLVHKGVWSHGRYVSPNISLANMYSKKVIGKLADRSIWNLDPVERYIAPESFIPQLVERCRGRIHFDHPVGIDEMKSGEETISTMPMSALAKLFDVPQMPKFEFAPITVKRFRIPNADVFQTVYFPDQITNLYRASITGDLLIAEYIGEEDNYYFANAFGIHESEMQEIEQVKQSYGKIAKIDEAWRKQFIFNMTTNHNIFSIGRFGTWRNILLDDVLEDISVVKKLLNTSTYDLKRYNAK